jgi:hypothetical protein
VLAKQALGPERGGGKKFPSAICRDFPRLNSRIFFATGIAAQLDAAIPLVRKLRYNTGMKLCPLDFVILAAALGVVCVFSVFVYDTGGNDNDLVVAIEGPHDTWLFPAAAEELVKVPGPLGNTIVQVGNGTAYVVSSPCANQLCVAQGKIHRPGGWISCLPNHVVVTIRGGRDEVDGGTW